MLEQMDPLPSHRSTQALKAHALVLTIVAIKEGDGTSTDGGSELAVVLDWFEEVKRLVPTNN